MIVEAKAVAATIGPAAQKTGGKSPGTRGKTMAMLRAELIKAREYQSSKQQTGRRPPGDKGASRAAPAICGMETLGRVLSGEQPLMITTHRAQDIASALRLAKEFDIKIWLDGASEAYLLIDDIKAAGVPVIVHPTMARAFGEHENLSFETAAQAGRGRHSRRPAKRLRSLRAQDARRAVRSRRGRGQRADFEQALRTITIDAAKSWASPPASARSKSARTATWPSTTAIRSSTRRTAPACVIDGHVVSETVR